MIDSGNKNNYIASNGRDFVGIVISDKMNKTIVVKVERTFKHPLLGKTITRFKKYSVHDANELASVGDWVEIVECRPISKTKHMILKNIIRSA